MADFGLQTVFRKLAVLPVAAMLALLLSGSPARAQYGFSCSASPKEELLGRLREFAGDHGAIETTPVTTILPPDRSARIVLRQSLNVTKGDQTNTVSIRALETSGTDWRTFVIKGDELPIVSVARMPDQLIPGFEPANATLVQVDIPEHTFPLWHNRSFVLVACSGNDIANWAIITRRVSSSRVAFAVCAVVTILTYFVAMLAVARIRNAPHPLAAKYPAYRVVRRIEREDFFNPIHLTADAFYHASVQKLQVILFSFLVGWMVLGLVLMTGVLIDLSPTVIGLLGISGVGAAVAHTTTTNRERLSFENWAWLVRKGALAINPAVAAGPRWSDLLMTNREFDIYKAQTIIFSVAVAFALLTAGSAHLAEFAVPDTLLGILGLSQVVYVAGILVRPPSVGDLDKAVTDLRKAEETARTAIAHDKDVDADGNLPADLGPLAANVSFQQRKEDATKALHRYDQLASQVEIMIESTLETPVDRRTLRPDLGEGRRMLGAVGGTGGLSFMIDAEDPALQVSELRIWYNTYVQGIQVLYRQPVSGEITDGGSYGFTTGQQQTIRLARGEYLTRIQVKSGRYVDSIAVQTSQRGYARVGGGGGEPDPDFVCEPSEEIIGFHGRAAMCMDALGVIVRARP